VATSSGRRGRRLLRLGRDASRIADEVIAHLAGQVGAELTVTLESQARLPNGASDQLVRTVMENSRTLKFDGHGFERENDTIFVRTAQRRAGARPSLGAFVHGLIARGVGMRTSVPEPQRNILPDQRVNLVD
jgi:hypothetical protein